MVSGDTICAISSAVGSAAARIIVRTSGPLAIPILQSIARDGTRPSTGARRMGLAFAGLECSAWVYCFMAPHSYTGEDLTEFHLPGNALLARMLIDDLIRRGARPAEAGEYTARAYVNGRLSLVQAEGVAAIIGALNQRQLRAARQLVAGELARRLTPIMDLLAQTLAWVEAGIDFAQDDVTFITAEELRGRIVQIDADLERLVIESARFERITHEPQIVLVGRPSAGKSSLLNALAGQQRAVVSPQPGTTRDALSAQVALERGIAHVVDVAGLEPDPETQPSHAPDHAGSIRLQIRQGALRAIAEADLVLLVRDLSDPRGALALPRRPDLTIGTKMDLPPAVDAGCVAICICALSGDGMAELRARLDMLAFGAAGDGGDALTLNARHVSAIADARAALAYAAADCLLNRDETVALALREALDALGHVLGTVTPDDVLGRIFSRFCIGK